MSKGDGWLRCLPWSPDTQNLRSCRHLSEAILRPAHASFRESPRSLPDIVARGTSGDVDRQQMLEARMCLSRQRMAKKIFHRLLSLLRRLLGRVAQRIVEFSGIGHASRSPKRSAEVAKVVHGHSRANQHHTLFTQRC